MTTDILNTWKEIPYGYCHCGCGGKTKLAPYNRKRGGWIKDKPQKYIRGHNSRNQTRSNICKKCNNEPRAYYNKKSATWCIKCIHDYYNNRREYNRIYERKSVVNLNDCYIRSLLTNYSVLTASEIPKEIINIWRLRIKLLRMVRKTKLKGEQDVKRNGNPGSSINPNQGA